MKYWGAALATVILASALMLCTRPMRAQKSRTPIPRVLGNDRTTDLSGLASLTPYSDLPYDDQDLHSICEMKQTAIRNALQASTDYLAFLGQAEGAKRDDLEMLKMQYQLGQLWAYQGEMRKSIEYLEQAHRSAAEQGLRDRQLTLEELLGIAELRRGEIENCLQSHNARSCIFPIRAEGRHKLVSGSEAAIRHFLKYLEMDPQSLEVRWLLNVAYMTLGRYPGRVPELYLIPPAAFTSGEDIGQFEDVAPALGLDLKNMAGSAVMEDFDNDGLLDLVTSSQDACSPMHYFHNDGNGKFSDRTAQAKLTDQLGGLNAVQADYNHDGRMDFFVMRGGWEFPMRNSLLRNNGDGTFTDVTQQAGLARPAYATHTAAWADFDNDGCLDLFVGHELAPSQLFRSKCDGTFEDVSARAGVNRSAFTKGSVWGDYDNDGYPDLYVSNYGEPNFLYRNNRDGTFTDVANRLGVDKPIYSFPAWFFDYNNDGCLDLFVAGFVQSVSAVAGSYLKQTGDAETMKLYRNNCRGGFEDVTRETGLDRVVMVMGANFGDMDNDGFPDFYLGTGSPSYAALVPNLLFRNRGGKEFVDITSSSGTGHLQKGHGVSFGDLNNDGSQEIFLHVGGALPGDAYENVVFRNPGNANNWLSLKLVGVKTNRSAIGTRVKAVMGSRVVYAQVSSGGSFGANPLEQHLGLGKASEVDRLEISWPTSGTRQVFEHVKANQSLEIREFEKSYRRVARKSFALGAGEAPASHQHATR